MKLITPYVAALLLVTNVLLLTRIVIGGVRPAEMQPRVQYFVSLQMSGELYGDRTMIATYLPADAPTQTILTEKIESNRLSYSMRDDGPNREARWTGAGLKGHEIAVYEATVEIQPRRFLLPHQAPIPTEYPLDLVSYLEATDTVQADAPEIREHVASLGVTPATDVATAVRTLFDYVQTQIHPSDYERTLDAVLTLKWGEAYCGGKSRLLAAMLRAANIPARLIGGLILEPGSKRITHVWVETWINGQWVPFDALNNHFAELPPNYLVLYYGDEVLFTHSADMNFQYAYTIRKWRAAPVAQADVARPALLNAYIFWDVFRKAHISLNLLRIILLLPVGVLIVILARNVIGLTTFGTFHPALMAVAFRDTGFAWGAGLYLTVLVLGLGLRSLLDRLQLLHTARLAIVLTFVVAFMLGVSYVSILTGVVQPAYFSLFPIAILTITVESAFAKAIELGTRQLISVMLQTLLVSAAVFVVWENSVVQAVVFTFPEVLLAVTAAFLGLGRWVGMRLTEFYRFRWLLVD